MNYKKTLAGVLAALITLTGCNKKELDDLDFCVDYKYDYNKSKKLTKKTFRFNQPFKDIWE